MRIKKVSWTTLVCLAPQEEEVGLLNTDLRLVCVCVCVFYANKEMAARNRRGRLKQKLQKFSRKREGVYLFKVYWASLLVSKSVWRRAVE
jgi:hypothetical protein